MSTAPPLPDSLEDQARWLQAGRLYRMMYGLHKPDIKARMVEKLGHIRQEAQGEPDMCANLYKAGFSAVAVMYDQPGKVKNPDGAAAARMSDILMSVGFWSLWQTVQRDTLGMRDMMVRVDIDRGDPVFRLVYPQWVIATARPQRPAVPVHVEEARMRTVDGEDIWTWDILDSETATYMVVDTDGADITASALLSEAPMAYPYVKTDGTAILPYSMYHARDTNKLWDTFSTVELYEGTLNLGVKYTNLGSVELKAAWSQRYIVGAQLAGVGITGATGATKRSAVVTDPSTVLLLDATEDGVQPQIGQWSTPANLSEYTEAITSYARNLASYIGDAADAVRVSGDPRSGYALSVKRDSQRIIQRRFAPVFARSDATTITIVATLLNRWHEGEGTPGWVALPEDGWSVTYRGIPLSADEKKAMREDHKARRAEGTLDIITAYTEENPGTTREEAAIALEQIRIVDSSYANARAPSRVEEMIARNPGMSAEQARRHVIDGELYSMGLELQISETLAAAGFGSAPKSTIELAPTDLAAIVTVNEARAQQGLTKVEGGDISVFAAKAQEQAKADLATMAGETKITEEGNNE